MKLGLLAPRFSQVSFGKGSKLPLALTMDSSIWGKRQGQWSECHLLHLLSHGGVACEADTTSVSPARTRRCREVMDSPGVCSS